MGAGGRCVFSVRPKLSDYMCNSLDDKASKRGLEKAQFPRALESGFSVELKTAILISYVMLINVG